MEGYHPIKPKGGLTKPKSGPKILAMQIGLHQYVLKNFASTDLSYQKIADGSGVPKRTVEKIARREIEDPGVSSIEKLAAFFRKREQRAA